MIEGAGQARHFSCSFRLQHSSRIDTIHMLLVGKQVWFGRAVLAAYLLLVCFGHALHALPGHQHSHTNCGCTAPASDSPSCSVAAASANSGESVCATGCQQSNQCASSSNHKHVSISCPFGHSSNADRNGICSEDYCSSECSGQKDTVLAWRDAGCDDNCIICEVLAAPQTAQPIVDVDLAIVPLYLTANAIYTFCAVDVPSGFSARGPPAFTA